MNTYRIQFLDKKYEEWEIYNTQTLTLCKDVVIDPIESKLFSNDVFSIDDNKKLVIQHSSVRVGPPHPGVLHISNNKTYGRHGKRLLYKCVPDDIRLPSFLIPYEMKHVGFSKVFVNLYVTFSFVSWEDKHPIGMLSQVIGPVDVLDNFYEYQLYCKSLNASIQKFNKDTTDGIKSKTQDDFICIIKDKYPSIVNRCESHDVFSIDPYNCVDFDDAFSIQQDTESEDVIISIYIANVSIWLEILDLWDSFSRRISTIYLPDKKRPMLPTILSDCLCSLQANEIRVAFTLDIYVNKANEIRDVKFSNCLIKLRRNFCYDDEDLLTDPKYMQLLMVSRALSHKYKYMSNVRNSHDVVAYLMILMNFYCAKTLLANNTGIFRSTTAMDKTFENKDIPEDGVKFIQIFNSVRGQYIEISDASIRHNMLDLDAYVHITSPIRRLVDLLNMLRFQQVTNMIHLSENAIRFYEKWLKDLAYINTTMKSIRKVQIDCDLLALCHNHPQTIKEQYDGYVFNRIERQDELFQYFVFLPKLKLSSRITTNRRFENYEKHTFALFVFNDEEHFKRKIRLELR